MMEVRDLRAKWQSYRQSLLRADYNQADEELARTMYFANNQSLISAILLELRNTEAYIKFSAETWLKGRGSAGVIGSGRTNLGLSLDEKERIAQLLRILEWAASKYETDGDALMKIGLTTYAGRSKRIDDSVRSAVENVFDPFYYYVDADLRAKETLITPVDIINQLQSLVDIESSVRYPETHRLLKDTYAHLFTLSTGMGKTPWHRIGYDCRHVLIAFANETFNPNHVPKGEEQPKGDDAKSKLKWTIRYYLKKAEAGERYRRSIEDIIQANWNFVNAVAHREDSSTEVDARLTVLHTYMTIWVLDSNIKHQT